MCVVLFGSNCRKMSILFYMNSDKDCFVWYYLSESFSIFDLIKIVWTIACDIPISEVIINVVHPLRLDSIAAYK